MTKNPTRWSLSDSATREYKRLFDGPILVLLFVILSPLRQNSCHRMLTSASSCLK